MKQSMIANYDVIVVGAGHAGCEAAAAAANLGSKVLLITMDMTKFAQMSCNPAMGGIAKGQIVREIDAMGGLSAIVTDKTTIQFRMLNRSKGPAMWSPRAQCDRTLFSVEWREQLSAIQTLFFWQDIVVGLLVENKTVVGVQTMVGGSFYCKAVVLTNGTFLNGLIHVGKTQQIGGRISEPSSVGITEQLLALGFETGRMKTGTPARIDGRTINFDKMMEQKGDENPSKFSYLPYVKPVENQLSCYVTYTNTTAHDVLRTGFDDSPLYNGTIKSIGPRYCPSIETKIITFGDKERHQLFLEPEGRNCIEYYLNGFSSSLPLDVQVKAINSIEGLEQAKLFRPGYAIEYDYFPPTQLYHTLETKKISNLFFAGQINGTTGYEEAAGQGLIAGINAHQKINALPNFTLSRDEAYIGVLIDDLVTKGVDEPYRMFTSRAEHRILLRQDNADARLTTKSAEIGLVKKDRLEYFLQKEKEVKNSIEFLSKTSVKPDAINQFLRENQSSEIQHSTKLSQLLNRPEISIKDIYNNISEFQNISNEFISNRTEVLESIEIEVKYAGYIEKEKQAANKLQRLENIPLPQNYDYSTLTSLSTEARQKLSKVMPKTLGQASRISGVSPSDINVLIVFLGR